MERLRTDGSLRIRRGANSWHISPSGSMCSWDARCQSPRPPRRDGKIIQMLIHPVMGKNRKPRADGLLVLVLVVSTGPAMSEWKKIAVCSDAEKLMALADERLAE